MDFIEGGLLWLFGDQLAGLLSSIGAPDWLNFLVSDAIAAVLLRSALSSAHLFIYISLSILEDSGYMARAAFIADKFMRRIGLPGKAFIPLLVGFGCTVPAIMATRTLESPQRPCFCLAAHSIYELWCKAARIYIFGDDLLPASCRTGDLRFIFLWNCDGDAHGVALKKDHIQERAGNFVMELPAIPLPHLQWHHAAYLV